MEKTEIQRIYVWEWPVRMYHWINFLCMAVLCVTGYIIGRPLTLFVAQDASFSYWLGTTRFIHFVSAFGFFFKFLFRIYWGFVGNSFARWHNFLPFRREQLKEVVDVLRVDILQAKAEPMDSTGHNALAGFTYFLSFLAFLFQVVTGFGLYHAMRDATLPRLFGWIVTLMGGDFAVRQWHHLMMWFSVIFSMIHVYLVFYHDYVEGRGVTSSMIGGWKFIEKRTSGDR